MDKWVEKFREEGSPHAFQFLIGTKADLDREIQPEEALDLMKRIKGAFFIEASALNGESVDEVDLH